MPKTPHQLAIEKKESFLKSKYTSDKLTVNKDQFERSVKSYDISVDLKKPKTGLLLVGLTGNNGSTLCASLLANKHKLVFETREGQQSSNFYGSMVMSSVLPFHGFSLSYSNVLPFLDPCELLVHGWDIYNVNLYEAVNEAKVLEPSLKAQLKEQLQAIRPMKSIYDESFIASNQKARANNCINGTKFEQMEQIRKDIKKFKQENSLDKIVVVWTASTERHTHFTSKNKSSAELMAAIKENHAEISPSILFAVACILENAIFINGSPQNTLIPEVVLLAKEHKTLIAGNDFKTGQTKMKAALLDYLVYSGIKVKSIASYNHLGNNDGLNLSEYDQFRSKEVTKSELVDFFIEDNFKLYSKDETIDQCIVIKYLPAVGDSKRAMDEYYSEIFMGGKSTIAIHNTCEDSLLAVPIIIDLVLIMEMTSRIQISGMDLIDLGSFLTSCFLKKPITNGCNSSSLFRQRLMLENTVKAIGGLLSSGSEDCYL